MAKEKESEFRALPEKNNDPNLIFVGYGCSLCNWTVDEQLQIWQALPKFAQHNNSEHLGTEEGSASITYRYKDKPLDEWSIRVS